MIKSRIPTLIAVTALVVAVFGATPLGQAATRLPKNSLDAAQLKRSAVSAKKLAQNAVTGAKVKDGSLLAVDFKAGQLPAGPQGPQGIRGVPGPPGPTHVTYVHTPLIRAPIGKSTQGLATCPSGQVVTGGGVEQVAKETGVSVNSSLPVKYPFASPAPNARLVWVNNPAGGYNYSFIVYAICVTPTNVSSY